MARIAVISFRLGGTDGVSVEAAKWISTFRALGHDVRRVAGDGEVDELVPGLAINDTGLVSRDRVERALDDCDLVVVENLCSLPLRPQARDVVYDVVHERPALFRHHDLPWQRERFVHEPAPHDEPLWRHVTINELSRRQLLERGITATTIYNHFDCSPPKGRRRQTRFALGLYATTPLVTQPTRALPRKNIAGALELASRLNAVYWLLGDAEDGYDDELDALVHGASVPVLRGVPRGFSINDVYAASDLVVMPSTWEGFGNPVLESVTHRRPLARHPYPVIEEIEAKGFTFFDLDDYEGLRRVMRGKEANRLDDNLALAREHFNLEQLPRQLVPVLESAGIT